MSTRICYHCGKIEAQPRSNFCSECHKSSRPLFYPDDRKTGRWKTVLLYIGAIAAFVWLAYETVKFLLTH